MLITKLDQARIAAAIRAAEAKTEGEIVCVLAKSSSAYALYPLAWASLIALALPWVLVATTALPVQRILLVQILVFGGLFGLLSLPALRHRLVPRNVQRSVAHQAAMQQFRIRGMAHKANRAGVLIFVSLEEHYARIIADEGISKRVDQQVWQGALDALLSHMSKDRVAEGFIAALERCGDVLAQHFPAGSSQANDLPDRIYLI